MRAADVPGAYAVARSSLFGVAAGESEEHLRARQLDRIGHLLDTDPGGSWVAERDGEVVGVAQALVREGLWGLSLFAVAGAEQGRGTGRRLLEYALTHRDGRARGWIVLSTERPAAMRRYALAGLDLHPAVAAGGIVDRSRLPDGAADGVEDAGEGGLGVADAIGRGVRGAGHARDLPVTMRHGGRLLVARDERGFALLRGATIMLLAARDDAAAQRVLWGALAHAPAGATASIDFLTAAQQWAFPVVLGAGLALSPDGPVFVRGDVGPLRPYIPSGAWL
jgi:GNAT superfamily N-acetyltransferase